MVEEQFILETSAVNGKSLRCTFRRTGDRFAHQIESLFDGETELVFSSIEGDESWPTSPPWQEMHAHEQPDGSSTLMLVGQAGKSLWSMSVTVDDNSHAMIFDVACRLREAPTFLGCTYRDHRGTGSRPVQITAISLDGLPTCPAIVSLDERVVVDATHVAEPPATVRWRYGVSFDLDVVARSSESVCRG